MFRGLTTIAPAAVLTKVIQPGYEAFAADSDGSVVGASAPGARWSPLGMRRHAGFSERATRATAAGSRPPIAVRHFCSPVVKVGSHPAARTALGHARPRVTTVTITRF